MFICPNANEGVHLVSATKQVYEGGSLWSAGAMLQPWIAEAMLQQLRRGRTMKRERRKHGLLRLRF